MSENLQVALQKIQEAQDNQLKTLDLSHLHLTYLPEEVEQLRHIETLCLQHNKLNNLPAVVGQLSNLKVLDASYNQISNISRGIRKLSQLEVLNLQHNKLNTLPRETTQLQTLTKLLLDYNNFTSLPSAVKYLVHLTELSVADNKINRITESISQLQQLEYFMLNGNKLAKLPNAIGLLPRLKQLNLRNNHLQAIPHTISELKKLQELNLSQNQLQQLPSSIGKLQQLQYLDLSFNQLNHLPREIAYLKQLHNTKKQIQWQLGLDLQGNCFNIPAEILLREPSELIQFVLDLQASRQKKPLHEAKLIFIGSGYVGKTSLINMLLNQRYNPEEQKTDGIQIKQWQVKRQKNIIKMHVWDFGGQEIMHATHKFFMTARSVYVLVINPRTEDQYGESEVEYWLKLIRSYAGNVPVVIAINKCETHKIDLAKTAIKEKYTNVVDFVETSCKKNVGIGRLTKAVTEAISRLEHIDNLLPHSYFEIKSALQHNNADYIPYVDYQKLCRKIDHNFKEKSMQTLMSLLHDLGIMLNFSEDRRLMDTQVLNPEWVTQGVYQIIISPHLIKKKGILTVKEIARILDKNLYPTARERFYIMDIMDRFELCYQVPYMRDTYFVPGAFSNDKAAIQWKHKVDELLRFQYHYDVMPSSIMSRFIVKVHEFIRKREYWRNGVVIEKDNCLGLITADPEERKIYIEVTGKGYRRDLLTFIRGQFDTLHARLSNLKVESKIPVDECGGVVLDYQDLLFHEEMGEETILVRALRTRLNIQELLNGIETAKERESRNTNLATPRTDMSLQPENRHAAHRFLPNQADSEKVNWYKRAELLIPAIVSAAIFLAAVAEFTGITLMSFIEWLTNHGYLDWK
ncbi:MAG: COR domain-containing protein [Chitinophagales bacterium]